MPTTTPAKDIVSPAINGMSRTMTLVLLGISVVMSIIAIVASYYYYKSSRAEEKADDSDETGDEEEVSPDISNTSVRVVAETMEPEITQEMPDDSSGKKSGSSTTRVDVSDIVNNQEASVLSYVTEKEISDISEVDALETDMSHARVNSDLE